MEKDPQEFPIDGTLDLHSFRPRDLRTLVPDYLEACHKKGILHLRIIHGKGKGALRRSVHALLEASPLVAGFQLGGIDSGSWGATLVELHSIPCSDHPERDPVG